MKDQVLMTVEALNDEFLDNDGLSDKYYLTYETNGNEWIVKFTGYQLIGSEDCFEEKDIGDLIFNGMRDIQTFLNIVIPVK